MGLTFKTPNGGRSAMAEANNNRGRFRTYSAPTPKKKAPAPTPRHRDAYVAPKAKKPSASPIKSTANTTPLAPAKITQGVDERPNGSFKGGLVSNAIAKAKPVASINYNTDDATETTNSKQSTASITAIKPATPKAVTPTIKSAPINISQDNKTAAKAPKYDQKYWADKLAEGEKTSGLLGEKLDTTYDYKGGPSIVTKATDPTIKGVRLGDKTSTTFVDGVEVATKTGNDPLGYDAKVTNPDIAGHIDDTQTVDPAKTNEEIKSIDDEIKTETDPVKLKALHQRRLMLMRRNNTNTKFAGLLDDADTKRSNLMSIR